MDRDRETIIETWERFVYSRYSWDFGKKGPLNFPVLREIPITENPTIEDNTSATFEYVRFRKEHGSFSGKPAARIIGEFNGQMAEVEFAVEDGVN